MNESVLSGKEAEVVGRQIFTALMNLGGYGPEHPMTVKAIDSAFEALGQAARAGEGLTLLLDRDRLYLDNHPIGERFNLQRLLKLMGDLKLESVLFKPSISRDQLAIFLNLLANPKVWPTLDDVRTELSKRQVDGLRLNYVFYRKVTEDEQVVSSDRAGGQSPDQGASVPDDLSPLLADLMSRIHENPTEAARLMTLAAELRDAEAGDDEKLVRSLTRYIDRLSRKLAAQENAGRQSPSADELQVQLKKFQQELVDMMSLRAVNAKLAEQVEEQLRQSNLKAAKPRPDRAMPERVMNASNMAFFLNREVKSSLRYETPFSCAMITIERIAGPDGLARAPDRAELDQLLPDLYRLLLRMLRDLDLIGSLDRDHQAVPLIIMPMTPHGNANIVRLRLEEALDNARFQLKGGPVQLLPAVTTLGFRPSTHKDLRGYMTALRDYHASVRNKSA
jgi:hypothetical protein